MTRILWVRHAGRLQRLPLLAAALLLAALAGCATAPMPTPAPPSVATPVVAPPIAPVVSLTAAPVIAAAAASVAASATPPSGDAATPAAAEPVAVAVDPLRPDVRLDLDDRAAQADLWTRLRAGFAIPDLSSSRVRAHERAYANQPEYVRRMTERGSRYLFHIAEELEKRRMPTELALLPIVESAFNPEAMSSAKASGMWQFMPSTGRVFELKQNLFRDDRRDVLASTRAALDYLQKLHGMFGDWHLALAAYNWGEGNVRRAIARNRAAHLPTDYASLRMPRETSNYVPKLQAVKNIVARPADFGIALPALANHPYFVAVAIERDIDVEVAARLAGLPADEFRALNPQMNKPVILAAGTPRVLLPYEHANRFLHALAEHPGPFATWTAWVVPKTVRPADAARTLGINEAELRDVNRIPPNMLVQAGSTLLVPRSAQRQTDVSGHLADHATMALAPDGPSLRKLSLKAGKRDSVASVAKRYRVSTAQVAQWNATTVGTQFRPGQTVLVYVSTKATPAKSARGTRVAKAARPGKSAKASIAKRGKVSTAKNTKPGVARTTAKVAKQ